MKISMQKLTWTSVGCIFALLAGAPALADDTELLLINPDPTTDPTPNVMFILDTSGSMDDDLSTTAPYDSATTYAGDCDTTAVYWTDVDVTPVCDAANEDFVSKSVFQCQYALDQMTGIGSYTNTMVQYRDGGKDGTGTGPARWQYLAPGYHDAPVECQADSGIHGDGRAGYLWAANGTDLADPWTNDANGELSWGSAPRNISYTFYDGNYLNWKNNPTTVTLSKMEILKSVTKQVLSSVHNLNVGIMRFNPNVSSGMTTSSNGGSVIQGLTDLDTNRSMILNTIDSLPADGFTPLSETMFENALYWHSLGTHYGTSALTDSGALQGGGTVPGTYETHEWDACAKNFNILITDGLPTQDTDTPGLLGDLPGMATSCDAAAGLTQDNDGQCLDDVAGYLANTDVDPNTDGDQLIITHTIGYNINLPILEETAADGGGDYFQANDVESLTETLLDIIANINDRSLSFSAPAVSVNTFNRTQNLNDMYITMFGAKSKIHWPGNLKKYRIVDGVITDSTGAAAVDPGTGFFADTALSYWTAGSPDGNDVTSGGAANKLPLPASRKLYTNNTSGVLTAATNEVSTANLTALDPLDFGLTGATGEPTLTDLINWARGDDTVRNEDNNVATTVRYAMGDPLHSQPAAVVYGGTAASPDVVVYVATNDGYLHAINGSTGIELWSFIPKQLLSNLERLYFNSDSRYKQYGIDGSVVPVIKDVNQDGTIDSADGDFVQLIFGMRRGGNTLFSLDVTDRNAPVLLWSDTFPDFGETWSTPVVAKIDIGGSVVQNSDKAVVVIGGGYDTVHDTTAYSSTPDGVGANIWFLDLKTGAELWHAGRDAAADLQLSGMTRAIPNEVRVVDLSGDGYADRMYATDLGGQILRFDIYNQQAPSSLVTGGVIAQLGAEGLNSPTAADTRRFYNAPDVALITDNRQQRRYISVNVGSGYRAHPFDLSAADRFYSLRDPDVFNQLDQNAYDNYDIATDGDLVEVSGQTQVVVTSSDRGWKFTLPANEKILADSLTFNDEVFFVAFTPDTNSAATCSAGQGTNFLYRMSAINGDPIVPNISSVNPIDSDDERRTTLQQGGIAPSPTILFPAPNPDCTGDDCGQPPLGCVGVECFDPGFDNVPVRTLWTQDGIQ
jgi:type IV pilus assembly protein PilY1